MKPKNPFKFGSVVDGPFFTDREEEITRITSYLDGENHLVLISPRRYGKTSLMRKVLAATERKYIVLDLQLVFTPDDFAAQLLKRVYRLFKVEKLKSYIKSFRIIPTVTVNPVTGEPEVSFRPGSRDTVPLEDVLNLIEKLGMKAGLKHVVVFDEFQEIFRIGKGLDSFLRSVMQEHKHVNYVFMGSSESMIREIFERKESAFYRFGSLMTLGKIPRERFMEFLEERFVKLTERSADISGRVLDVTLSHPYYTQQLAYHVWEIIARSGYSENVVALASDEIVVSHDNDFERIWNSLNRTDMLILNGMSLSSLSPQSEEFSREFGTGAVSTVFSSLQRLAARGVLIKEGSSYYIDDPFFRRWIVVRRSL